MKYIIVIGLIVVTAVGMYVTTKSTEVLVQNKVVEKTVEVTPDWATDEDAVKAAQDVIRRKVLEEELNAVEGQIETLTTRQTEIQDELKTYWRDPRNVKALIRATFPEDPHTAVAVASCESGLRPNARNLNNRDGSTDGGVWQLNSVHDKRLEQLGLDKYDPEDATKFARILYEENGWRPWVCAWHKDHLAMNIR